MSETIAAPATRRGTPGDPALRRVLAALEAIRDGDTKVRLRADGDDVVDEIARTVNDIAARLARQGAEATRVQRATTREGRLGERASADDLPGAWGAPLAAGNAVVEEHARLHSEVMRVVSGVVDGDLTPRIDVRGPDRALRGEALRDARVANTLATQIGDLTTEVTRAAAELGVNGQLGGQVRIRKAPGAYADLVDAVNTMLRNVGTQVRGIVNAVNAVAAGDLSTKVPLLLERGDWREEAERINGMIDMLREFAAEVTGVAHAVGTEGRLGGQAKVDGARGVWRDTVDQVNLLAANLTSQVRDISSVARAVARGDLSQKITVNARGEVAELADTLNSMTGTLQTFADEVTRVAREVGTEGRLGGQAKVPGVSGTWKDLTDSVNRMAGNLTDQVRNIAQVTTAVAQGDLSQKITVDVKGELLELKSTVNTMVDQLSSFASEVTRVAREVGSEGRLGGQAQVPGVSGTWKDLTDSVNGMGSNLTSQVRNIAQVTTAVARGDLSQKITVDVKGELLELKSTVNTMVDQLSSFASEVTRVAREVGGEGRLGGQAQVPGVSGTWRDLTDSVNFMAGTLTAQVRNIAQVTTAVARGDLTQKITVDAQGEVASLADTINTMVDTLSAFASEVTRVAREVGTDGKLGGQADVQGVSGTWKDLTESVNGMAGNLTGQVRNIAQVTTAVARGDLSQKITVDARGEILELKTTINTMVDQLSGFADEVTRVAREVGTDGNLGGQAIVRGVSGTWKDLTDNVNSMASNLTGQVRSIAAVSTAVARGDLSQKITVEAKGEVAALADTINTMVDTLRAFADEVTRVAREVGTEGILGGQARVPNVAGTWKDLTDNVNGMANNLTNQVRSIALVTTAVARGDLTKKIDVDARGEILELKTTINTMVDQLSAFASEVTRVAREVGTEGKLGGQAEVEGVSGTWKRLTENVNQLASTLTVQLRAIAEVSTAVTRGDLTRQVTVDASGEILELKDNVNQMIANLRETTQANQEQDWLKTNLARITGLMQGRRDLLDVARMIMNELTPVVGAQHGAFFTATSPRETLASAGGYAAVLDRAADAAQTRHDVTAPEGAGDDGLVGDDGRRLQLIATYGYTARKSVPNRFRIGESLVGQAALEGKPILVTDAPSDYIRIGSGLGEAPPVNLVVLPVQFEDQVLGVIELGSFGRFTEMHLAFLDQLIESIGVSLNAIIASSRTEELLAESQRLAVELQEKQEELQAQQEELRLSNAELEQQAASLKASEELLQTQQEELQQTNAELEEKAALLAEQNHAIEIKNAEIEQARRALEERAEQLALSSRYKSEFLANMSHELRTPLNSLLILARLLADNADANLTDRQVEFARTIHNAGTDLLQLINDILDLSKVEAGKMDVSPADVAVDEVAGYARATFAPMTEDKGLTFDVTVEPDAPAILHTDEHRLQQVLRNLLSNAVKFTHTGSVHLRIAAADAPMTAPAPARDVTWVAFAVADTGIGIPEEKLRVIFEAFQQADGTTSRRYGGTGLGLSISREIARLLGGEISVMSTPGSGSTFTLTLPVVVPEPHVTAPSSGRTDDMPAIGEPMPTTTPGNRPGAGTPTASAQRPFAAATGPGRDPAPAAALDPAEDLPPGPVPDDRHDIGDSDRLLLVVSDDPELSSLAVAQGRDQRFKVVVIAEPDVAVDAARRLGADAVIVGLDTRISDGTGVLEALKRSPQTRHLPVHVVAGGGGTTQGADADTSSSHDPSSPDGDEQRRRRRDAMQAGALSVITAPVTGEALAEAVAEISGFLDRRVRRLLVVEDDDTERAAIIALVGGGDDVEVVGAADADEALAVLDSQVVDCVVLDLALGGTSGFALLEQVRKREELHHLPVIIYTGKDLTRREETRLRKFADTIIVKDVRSPERLLDETALFLHRVQTRLPSPARRLPEPAGADDAVFADRTVLIVDDDVRNVFALTSALEQHGMRVIYAENGREGLETLHAHPEVDLVLMDVMMPEMDGYATTSAIREEPRYAKLPIIALTAKAMKGDRERSIAAGASDYVTKPVDLEQLLSLIRVWLYG